MRFSFLSQVWLYYTDTEELLSALAGLCFVVRHIVALIALSAKILTGYAKNSSI